MIHVPYFVRNTNGWNIDEENDWLDYATRHRDRRYWQGRLLLIRDYSWISRYVSLASWREYPSCHNYSCLRRRSWPINASNFQQLPCPGSETEICSWRSRRVLVAVRRSLDGPPGNWFIIGKIASGEQSGERMDKKARTKRLLLHS